MRYLIVLVAVITVAEPARAEVINVPADFPTIQAAIDAAKDGDEVVVAAGVYAGDGFRNLSYAGKAITIRSESGPEACTIDCEGGPGSPRRAFVFIDGEGRDAVLDGFTIVGGYAEIGGPHDDHGGAIFMSHASPTIRNCAFNGCSASPTGAGGAINADFGAPLIEDCFFSFNDGSFGGALGLFECDAQIDRCVFQDNNAVVLGGGVWAGGGSPELTACTLRDNAADWGGGISFQDVLEVRLEDCAFECNVAARYAGGMQIWADTAVLTDCTFARNRADDGDGGAIDANGTNELTATDCIFDENLSAKSGGAFTWGNFAVLATFTRCIFQNNEAVERDGGAFSGRRSLFVESWFGGNLAGRKGGAVEAHGASTLLRCALVGNVASEAGGGGWLQDATLVSCLVADNAAGSSGGGVVLRGTNTVVNVTVAGNTAGDAGGGILATGLSSWVMDNDISNTIVWGNTAPLGSALALTDEDPENPSGGVTAVAYGNLEGGENGVAYDPKIVTLVWGAGNVDVDPAFRDRTDGDYRMTAGSPCIDAANNEAVPEGNTEDLAGSPRFVDDPDTEDTGSGDPPIVDMGAYEFQLPCPADIDASGDVGFADLLRVLAHWGPCLGCPEDLDDSGDVGFTDLLIVLANWGPCPE